MPQVFVPSIWGQNNWGSFLYGGQWVTVPPPPGVTVPTTPLVTQPTPVVIPAGYSVAPFTAQAVGTEIMTVPGSASEQVVVLSWTEPTGPYVDFRLLRNRYGFPVDENDGAILLDSETLGTTPGDQYVDGQVIPGTYQYYGIYILIQLQSGQVWYRAGLTCVLTVGNYASTEWIYNKFPEYFKIINTSDLTSSIVGTCADNLGNPYIGQFLSIFGWGIDYLQTQLAVAGQVNNPQVIPINYLANLAATLGFPFYPEMPSSVLRNAISNQAALVQQRGTLEGIEAMIEQLTGWGADVWVGYNQLLEEDQSHFTDPVYTPWSALISYDDAELVSYNGFVFTSAAAGNFGNAPFLNGNPYFAGGSTTGWAGYQGTISASQAILGGPAGWSLKFVSAGPGASAAEGSGSPFYISPSTAYTCTAWVYSASSFTAQIGFDWDSGSGSFESTSTQNFAISASTWTQITTTQTSPSNAAITYPRVGCTAAGVTMYIQAVLVTTSSTVWWDLLYYTGNSAVLANPVTGWLNTWEPLIDGMALEHPTSATALTEMTGILSPTQAVFSHNGLAITNNSGSTSNIELRSVSRTPADITAGATYPDAGQVIGDGIPVPFTMPGQAWQPSVQYPTGSVVTYNALPFLALKSSGDVTPPVNGVPTNEWQPLGYDSRIALMLSAYTSQNLTIGTDEAYAVTPYVLWFDETGTLISLLYVRAASGSAPASITFQSFALPSKWGTALASTSPDIGTYTWVQETGTWTVSAFQNGSITPASQSVQTLAVINYGSANAFVGVTLLTLPASGSYVGLAMRWSSDTAYIKVDQTSITEINGSTYTSLATHSTAFSAGDRMTVSVNSSNVYTVYRNGAQVSTATNSFNSSATYFGVVVDQHSP